MRIRKDGPPTKISDLFEVYKKRLRAPQGSVIAATVEVIHDVLGITIETRFFAYTPTTHVLHIKAPGPIKSEIMLRKEEILNHLKGRLGEKSAPTQIL
jgi:hypothetical protein